MTLALRRACRRRGKDDVAPIAAAEQRSLLETAHLMASPANARRLTHAFRDAIAGRNMTRMSASVLRGWSAPPVPEKRVGRRKA